ncbi:hypothetical protein HAX54_004133, partial [Datura stramonium]|nr:hypothetical protein [Datura stramonium]
MRATHWGVRLVLGRTVRGGKQQICMVWFPRVVVGNEEGEEIVLGSREGSDRGGSRWLVAASVFDRREGEENGDGVAVVRRRRQWMPENGAGLGDFCVISGENERERMERAVPEIMVRGEGAAVRGRREKRMREGDT